MCVCRDCHRPGFSAPWWPCPTRQETQKQLLTRLLSFSCVAPGRSQAPAALIVPSGSAGSGHHHVLLSTQINRGDVFVWHRLLFCIFRRGITK